jgi:hypothetical protein
MIRSGAATPAVSCGLDEAGVRVHVPFVSFEFYALNTHHIGMIFQQQQQQQQQEIP